jgi:ribosome maturation factor RimP
MITKEQITTIVEDQLKGTDNFLVEVAVQTGNRLFVYIDGDNGVTVDDCNALCRHIEDQFDRDLEDFDLTVSSSGSIGKISARN